MSIELAGLLRVIEKLEKSRYIVFEQDATPVELEIFTIKGKSQNLIEELMMGNNISPLNPYVKLLCKYDGIVFNNEENRFFSLDEVIREFDRLSNTEFVPIASFSQDVIFVKNNSEYNNVYIGNGGSIEGIYSLECTIEDFIDQLLVFQIQPYWRFLPYRLLCTASNR